jgi:hypothetical protein
MFIVSKPNEKMINDLINEVSELILQVKPDRIYELRSYIWSKARPNNINGVLTKQEERGNYWRLSFK